MKKLLSEQQKVIRMSSFLILKLKNKLLDTKLPLSILMVYEVYPKELRLKRGVTQEQMANDLGVTVETISRIERGVRGASIDLISILSGYFNTTGGVIIRRLIHGCGGLL